MALHDAISFDQIAVVKSVLEKDASCVNSPSWHGITPLHRAATKGSLEFVEILLRFGADVNACNNFGETPLHFALHSAPLKVIHALLQQGADIRAADNAGRTCAHHAARSGCVLKLCYLENLGVDLKQKDNRGQTVLHIVADSGSIDAVEFCLRKKRFSAGETDNNNMTPLHVAAKQANCQTAWLLERNSEYSLVAKQDVDGKTPVDYAAEGNTNRHYWLARNLKFWHSGRCPPNKPPVPWLPWILLLISPNIALLILYLIQSNLSVFMSRTATVAFLVFFHLWAFTKHRIRHISGWQSPTFFGFFFGMILHSLICYSYYLLPQLWPELFWTPVALLSFIAAVVFVVKIYKDPGVSRSPKVDEQGKTLTAVDIAMGRAPEESFCYTCEMVMGDYVKHCRLCEKCMVAIDHHCLFLMHCIAVNNHKAFILFLVVIVMGNLLFIRAALEYFFIEATSLGPSQGLQDVMATEVWLTIMFVFNVCGCLWIFVLVLYQLKIVSEGATTFYFPNGETKYGVSFRSDFTSLSGIPIAQRLWNVIRFFLGEYNFYKNVTRKKHIV